jgi:hypothetical protein
MKKINLFLLCILISASSAWGGALQLDTHNFFRYYNNLHPSRDKGVMTLLGSSFNAFDIGGAQVNGGLFSGGLTAIDDPDIVKEPLVYPNPVQLSDQSYLGYSLNKAMDVEIRFYDMRGYEILKKQFNKNTNGGYSNGAYNKIIFNKEFFGQYLPAGVYFAVMFGDGEYIGKFKFAVEPN